MAVFELIVELILMVWRVCRGPHGPSSVIAENLLLRIGFQKFFVFEFWFLILLASICHFPALTTCLTSGQGRDHRKMKWLKSLIVAGTLQALDEALAVDTFTMGALPWADLAFPSTRHALAEYILRHTDDAA